MNSSVIKSVQTQGVGFAPILRYYFEKCGIAKIIDDNVPLDPRRTVLTHGEASISMITGILFQTLQLYKLCKFATETTILDVILPQIDPGEYFDDRLADTLDALYAYGIGNLEMLLTKNMISEFNINHDICHNDTTSVSTYGDCKTNPSPNSIEITYGFSKKKRQDLKQFVLSLSVSSDSGFPLFQKAYSGNTADVETYIEQWHNLIDLLDRDDFLYVADSKLTTKENTSHIHDNGGFFVSPAPMYESYKTVFHAALNNHDQDILIPYKDKINRGFETPFTFEYEGKSYQFRMIILFDHGLFATKSKAMQSRIDKTKKAFCDLQTKLNTYNLKTCEDIEKACSSILKKNKTSDFFTFTINNDKVTRLKNKKRGRPSKNKEPEQVEIEIDQFDVALVFNEIAFEEALFLCGYYPLITNKPESEFSISDVMLAYKNQYKSEHLNRRAKSNYNIEPIYLHTPKRIEALMLLFKTALQVVVLIERNARQNIQNRDKGLDNFMPNRKDVRNPRTEYMLSEFQYIVSGEMTLPDGKNYKFISELNNLQKDILSVLDVPLLCFSYEYIFGNT